MSKADRERYQEVLAVLAKHKVGKGRHWFTEFDLRNGAAIKCDKSGKSTLQVLRHLKRLTEVRALCSLCGLACFPVDNASPRH